MADTEKAVVDFNITPELVEMLSKEQKEELAKYLSSQFKVVVETSRIYNILYSLATSDITDFYETDKDGTPVLKKDIKELPGAVRQQIKSIDVTKDVITKPGGDRIVKSKVKLQMHDKTKILEYVMKYFDMFGENRPNKKRSEKVEKLLAKTRDLVLMANRRLEGAEDADYEEKSG